MVEKLTATAKTDQERVEAVFYYVSQKIRYMGITPEKDRPGFEPHDVRLTFENKYGVCRDKAALLVSMLRLAGFKAYPVLILAGGKKDREVPDPGFNHAIVGVELTPKEYTLMDPTDENTKDLFPAYLGNCSYLVACPEGETLRTTPVISAEKNLTRIHTTARLELDGKLSATTELIFEGVNDNSIRGAFARMKPDEQRRVLEGLVKVIIPGAKLGEWLVTPENMLDTSVTPKIRVSFTAEGATVFGNGKAIVNLPWFGKRLGMVSSIVAAAGLEKRKYPLVTGLACGVVENLSMELGEGFTGAVSLPSGDPVENSGITFQQHVDFKNGTLLGSRSFRLKTPEFSPEEYLDLKRLLKSIDYDERKQAVLAAAKPPPPNLKMRSHASAPTPVESDVELLESRIDLRVEPDETIVRHGSFKKRILNYSGKKSEAEFRVYYNPACQNAKILKGTVTSTNGVRQELSPQEINIMDAGWNASAKRYTGGKTLVANLPGVDVGSVIEVEYETTSKGQPLPAIHEVFQSGDALDSKIVKLHIPTNITCQRTLFGPPGLIAERVTSNATHLELEWEAKDVKALPDEPSTPPLWAFAAQAWLQLGNPTNRLQNLHRAMMERSLQSTQAAVLAKTLVAPAKTRLEALQAIRDHVAKSIRIAGPSFRELPLKELSPADTTLAEGYGHVADRAILLHAMLTAAGFQPEWIFTGSLPETPRLTDIVKQKRMLSEFDLFLVRVQLDGKAYYLNDTDQYARMGSTASDARIAIRMKDLSYETVQPIPECTDKSETQYSISLSDNGQARIKVRYQYFGSHFDSKKRFFAELPPEKRRRYHQNLIAQMTQGARPVGDLITQFDQYPGLEEFAVEIDQYAVVDGAFYTFELPYGVGMFGARQDQRVLPLFSSQQGESSIRTLIDLPAGFRKVDIAPVSQEFRAPQGAGVAITQSKADAGQWQVLTTRTWSPTVVPPEDYPTLVEIETELGRPNTRTFLLEK
jgi:transglutaminase-like putative cysteine protease